MTAFQRRTSLLLKPPDATDFPSGLNATLSTHLSFASMGSRLSLRVLSVDDLGFDSKGGSLFMIYQQQKERLASQGAAGG